MVCRVVTSVMATAFLKRSPATWALGARTLQATPAARFYTPISTSANARATGDASLNVALTVRNALAPQGRLQLQLPLPGLAGLSPVQINDGSATVQHLIDTIKKADASLKAVEITTKNGTKIARTMHLRELTSMDFMLRLNHVNISIENEGSKDDSQLRSEGIAFASVKAAIEKDSRPFIPLSEFYRICLNAGAEEAVANKWLRELQRRDLAVHFEHSKNPELKNAVILRPNGSESQLMLQNALDSELYNVKHARKRQEDKLLELQSDLAKALQIDAETHKVARKIPNTGKWIALTGITSFYGSLMYLVWDVYSWDIMEPITYFIGFTAVLGNSFYHSITKKDATYTNIWQKHFLKRLAIANQERRFNPSKIDDLKKKIEEVKRDVDLLTSLEGKAPAAP